MWERQSKQAQSLGCLGEGREGGRRRRIWALKREKKREALQGKAEAGGGREGGGEDEKMQKQQARSCCCCWFSLSAEKVSGSVNSNSCGGKEWSHKRVGATCEGWSYAIAAGPRSCWSLCLCVCRCGSAARQAKPPFICEAEEGNVTFPTELLVRHLILPHIWRATPKWWSFS